MALDFLQQRKERKQQLLKEQRQRELQQKMINSEVIGSASDDYIIITPNVSVVDTDRKASKVSNMTNLSGDSKIMQLAMEQHRKTHDAANSAQSRLDPSNIDDIRSNLDDPIFRVHPASSLGSVSLGQKSKKLSFESNLSGHHKTSYLTMKQKAYIMSRLKVTQEIGFYEILWMSQTFGVPREEIKHYIRRKTTNVKDEGSIYSATTSDGSTTVITTTDKRLSGQTTYSTTIVKPSVMPRYSGPDITIM